MSKIYRLTVLRNSILAILLATANFAISAKNESIVLKKLYCSVTVFSNNIKQPTQNCNISYDSNIDNSQKIISDCFSPGSVQVEFTPDTFIDNNKFKVIKKITKYTESLRAISYVEVKEQNNIISYEIEIDIQGKKIKGRSAGPFGHSDIVGSCY